MLFSCRPLAGHYEPLLPLAAAAKAAGHAVAFATGDPYVERARREGSRPSVPGGARSFRAEWTPRFPGFERLVGDEQRRFFLTEVFANLELVPRAEELERVVDAWAPTCSSSRSRRVGRSTGRRGAGDSLVDVSYGSLIPSLLLRAAGEAAAPHWRARGLEPDPLAGLFRHLYVDTWPPSLQNPEIERLAAVQALRPGRRRERPTDEPPAWLDRLGGMPIVYVTMGTIWNRDLDMFRHVIEAVRDEALALVVTVGRQNDPAVLGPQPDNVVVHRYVPQAILLGQCDAVITHGGSGTTLGRSPSVCPSSSSRREPTSTPTPTTWLRLAQAASSGGTR